MNIILSGYGKMGREVESIALGRGHKILARYDTPGDWESLASLADKAPVVIDFSQPDAVVSNIFRCFDNHVPVVVGTTGWNQHTQEIREACAKGKQALLTASNFSIGMNIFFAVNDYLSGLMNKHEDYDVSISETHHIHKLDTPSGTAITLAEQILRNLDQKKAWVSGESIKSEELSIGSNREGEVFGDHTVTYDSQVDRIMISHSARNRKGFALGAVMAAEWIQGRTGFFGMRDMLGI